MKSGHEYELSVEQQQRVVDLIGCFDKDPQVFSVEGLLFLGDKIEVTKRYVALNPSKKFFIWLQDSIPMLTKHESK